VLSLRKLGSRAATRTKDPVGSLDHPATLLARRSNARIRAPVAG
jgi:hypothetical protein